MPQSGNHTICKDSGLLWNDKLHEKHKEDILDHVDLLINALDHDVPDPNDLVEDRGSQITLSVYGHNAPHAEKLAFDPDFSYRKILLAKIPFNSETTEVHVTGSTCFDYTVKGRNKGFNVERFIKHKGWNKDDCVYFGDALFRVEMITLYSVL